MLLSIILESLDEDKDGAISKKDSPAGARRSRCREQAEGGVEDQPTEYDGYYS